jgi:hypothetical protein
MGVNSNFQFVCLGEFHEFLNSLVPDLLGGTVLVVCDWFRAIRELVHLALEDAFDEAEDFGWEHQIGFWGGWRDWAVLGETILR